MNSSETASPAISGTTDAPELQLPAPSKRLQKLEDRLAWCEGKAQMLKRILDGYEKVPMSYCDNAQELNAEMSQLHVQIAREKEFPTPDSKTSDFTLAFGMFALGVFAGICLTLLCVISQ